MTVAAAALISDPVVSVQLSGPSLEKALHALKRGSVGLEHLEFARAAILDGDWKARLQEAQRLCAQFPGPISMHGPFLDLKPFSPEPGLVELTRRRYLHALHIAGELGARQVVLHTQFHPELRMPEYPARFIEGNLRFWSDLLPEIEKAGTTVVLENMWDPCPDYLAELLDRFGSPHLKACLDTGHANIFSRVPLAGWVRTLGNHLAYVHLSDNHGGWDEHLALGDGSVDFEPFFRALAGRGASAAAPGRGAGSPVFVVEVPEYGQVVRSLETLGWSHLIA